MKKQYQTNGKNGNIVTYGSRGPKWVFSVGSFTLLFPCGGAENAHKIANVVSGSFKRTEGAGLDNLGRANINQIVTA